MAQGAGQKTVQAKGQAQVNETTHPAISASAPSLNPPLWAVLERKLIDELSASVHPYLERFTHASGERQHELIWGDVLNSRDGADDFYESFYNFPLLYLLGGADELLELGHRQWDAVTRQTTRLGNVLNEYERGYDQFHQSESYIYFYLLCLADPDNPKLIERAQRFAGLFLGEEPNAPNYDPEKNIIRAPHNGSGGPRWGMNDDGAPVSYGWSKGMSVYGLPYYDLPGITSADDLRDPANAQRMGQAMERGMSRGDVAANLGVSTLIANAGLLTGDEKYARWLERYVSGWRARAEANGGLLPDNVGLSGEVGEYLDGKWYGGLYGWTWPHGFYNLQYAAIVAAQAGLLLSGDRATLRMARCQHDRIMALGDMRRFNDLPMSLRAHWIAVEEALPGKDSETFVVPYRYGDIGWFDYMPMSAVFPGGLWALSGEQEDWSRIDELRAKAGYDWRQVRLYRTKEDGGHEQPWFEFLSGRNPDYPEAILRESLGVVNWRLDQLRADNADLACVNIHYWQEHNPVTTEALIQLTLGAPQIIYNGGLLIAPLRYFDAERRRPGLPRDIAALVSQVGEESLTVTMVNINPREGRSVIVQAGGFGEHSFDSVQYTCRAPESGYPGREARYEYGSSSYAPPDPLLQMTQKAVGGKHLQVKMPPGSEVTMTLRMRRHVNKASYATPWTP